MIRPLILETAVVPKIAYMIESGKATTTEMKKMAVTLTAAIYKGHLLRSRNLVLALQWTTLGHYLGYKLTTQFGFSYTKLWEEAVVLGEKGLVRKNESKSFGTSFISVYAGVE